MVIKKIDNRIRINIENGVESEQRSMFVIVGDKGRDQIPVLYNILMNARVKARPSVLWCYKKELNFNNSKKKRMHRLQKRIDQGVNVQTDNIFDIFVESSNIRFTYYKDAVKILGNTFGMLILQDFEALTPNIMARTIETIEGGGIICLLLSSINDLRQLYTFTMDVHSRYRTESHQNIVGRFNERFLLSLNECANCLILDDNLNVLPIFTSNLQIEPVKKRSSDFVSQQQTELNKLCLLFSTVQPIATVLSCCKTIDQAKVCCKIFEIISSNTTHNVISFTAARGRGKSALLGLVVAGAISMGFSNIYVVAPGLENLVTFFQFVCKGLHLFGFESKSDYEITYVNINNQKHISKIKVNKSHRQVIQYIAPQNGSSIQVADMIVCDECAAIPLPYVRTLLGPHLLILSSTINGYEGTGRSLSLKLIKELKEKSLNPSTSLSSKLIELTLESSIRYSNGDPIEKWLNMLLCLDDSNAPKIEPSLLSSSQECHLFYVSRDTLFSFHKVAEMFLQTITSIFVSSHYKNSPNDLQMMADAPAHHVFVLLPTANLPKNGLPQVLCVIQICFEGGMTEKSVNEYSSRGQRANGDLIPWTISQQFCESDFASLTGVRIVRISTHPDYTNMGYGSRAMELLIEYFGSCTLSQNKTINNECESMRITNDVLIMEEEIVPRSKLPPLLINVKDRQTESIDYLGVSYGLTGRLLKFWKRLHFIPVYLRQTPNQITGEFTNIMLRPIVMDSSNKWLNEYFHDFRSRFVSLLAYTFRDITPSIALSLMYHEDVCLIYKSMNESEIDYIFTSHDIKRLQSYANNMVDYHLIMDLVPAVAKLLLTNRIEPQPNNANWFQLSIVLALGLQFKSVDMIEKHLNIPAAQILSTFNKIIRRTLHYFTNIKQDAISTKIGFDQKESNIDEHQKVQVASSLKKYAIIENEQVWNKIENDKKEVTSVSIPRAIKRKNSGK